MPVNSLRTSGLEPSRLFVPVVTWHLPNWGLTIGLLALYIRGSAHSYFHFAHGPHLSINHLLNTWYSHFELVCSLMTCWLFADLPHWWFIWIWRKPVTWLMNDITLIHRIFTTLQFTYVHTFCAFFPWRWRATHATWTWRAAEAAARGFHPWYVHSLWGKWCWCGVDWQIHSWKTLLEWISDLAGQEEEQIIFPHFTERLDTNYASLLVNKEWNRAQVKSARLGRLDRWQLLCLRMDGGRKIYIPELQDHPNFKCLVYCH